MLVRPLKDLSSLSREDVTHKAILFGCHQFNNTYCMQP